MIYLAQLLSMNNQYEFLIKLCFLTVHADADSNDVLVPMERSCADNLRFLWNPGWFDIHDNVEPVRSQPLPARLLLLG
jgi:hypothetical protein